MMWWSGDGTWSHGWWWPGLILMTVFMLICMAMMARMMRHGMSGSRPWNSGRDHRDVAERMLANRLASGEIDLDDYERLRDALQRTGDSTREQGGLP